MASMMCCLCDWLVSTKPTNILGICAQELYKKLKELDGIAKKVQDCVALMGSSAVADGNKDKLKELLDLIADIHPQVWQTAY